MKSLFALITLVGSLSSAVTIEPGTYQATDVETKTIVAVLIAREDNTVNFTVTAPDFEIPAPGCEGTYAVDSTNMLKADIKCPIDLLPEAQVTIDVSNITPETIRQDPGAIVNVVIDAIGPDQHKFYFKKLN